MKNIIASVAIGLSLLVAGSASAASITDARFSNNQTSIDATGGASVSGTFTLTVGPGEVVEWFRNIPNGNPFTEQSVGGQLGYQEGVYTNVPFSVKVPPNTGTYNVDVQGAGIYGGNRAINGGDNVVVGPTTVGQVRVVASGGSNNGSGNSETDNELLKLIQDLRAEIAALKAQLAGANTKPAWCASLAAAAGNTFALQSVLVGAGFMTQAQVNTGPGIYGPKTTLAHAQAQAACR